MAAEFPKNWIFVRGLTRSRYHWLGFENRFKAQLNLDSVQCVEVPGNGYLNQKKSPKSLDDTVQMLREQLKNNSSQNQTYGLLGISMGGMISARWAQLFPEEITHLTLINSSFKTSRFYKRLRPSNYFLILKMLLNASPLEIETFIMSATSNDEVKWRSQLTELVEFHTQHPIQLRNFLRQLNISRQAIVKNNPCKNTLILASYKDRFTHSNCSQKIADAWKCPVEFHPKAGHDLPLDDGQWVIEQIRRNFISKN